MHAWETAMLKNSNSKQEKFKAGGRNKRAIWILGIATTALTLPSTNSVVFNLAINGQIRQIAKLKLPPNFPVITVCPNYWDWAFYRDLNKINI